MSNISEIDRNFAIHSANITGMRLWDVRQAPFSLHGLYNPAQGPFRRMPQDVADTVNGGVSSLCRHTAGGRLRFRTDSMRVAVQYVLPQTTSFPHMPATGTSCFDLYANGQHIHAFLPGQPDLYRAGDPIDVENGILYQSLLNIPFEGMKDILIHFPLYNEVADLKVALEEGASVLSAAPYAHPEPVVFYGSSITQGGCVSHGGTAYSAIISRRLSTDFVNLGFSGSCLAEAAMADYLATLPMSVLVYDYDHNAQTAEYLQKTHEPLYLKIRAVRPELPIIIVSAADSGLRRNRARREAILATYENALARGDENVYFVDGDHIYDEVGEENCRVDNTHPNDLGHFCMARAIGDTLQKIL